MNEIPLFLCKYETTFLNIEGRLFQLELGLTVGRSAFSNFEKIEERSLMRHR